MKEEDMFKAYVVGGQSEGHNTGYRVQLCDGPISVCYGPVFSDENDAWRFHAYCMEHFGGRVRNWFANCYAGIEQPESDDLSRIHPLY